MNRQLTESEGRGMMPNAVRRKLRSQSGVSILVVLLVFLLCATSGSAILTAATASAGRVKDRNENDQAYYSVLSAARLFASQVEGQKVTLTVPKKESRVLYSDGSAGETRAEYDLSYTDGPAALTLCDSGGTPADVSSYDLTTNTNRSVLMDVIYAACAAQLKENSDDGKTARENAWKSSGDLLNKPAGNISYWFTMTPDNTIAGVTDNSGGIYKVYGRVGYNPDKDPADGGTLAAVFSNMPFLPDSGGSGSYQVQEKAFAVAMTLGCTGAAKTETVFPASGGWEETGDDGEGNPTGEYRIMVKTFTFTFDERAEIGEG